MSKISKQVILKYIKKYNGLPKRTIARHIIEEEHLDIDIDYMRDKVRYYTGSHGESSRKYLPTRNVSYKNYKIDDAYKKILLINDVHLPYHDKNSIYTLIENTKNQGIDLIFLNGDILDFATISKFNKDKNAVNIQEEIDYWDDFIEYIKTNYPKVDIMLNGSNHHERIQKYIQVNAQALDYLEALELESILKLKDYGIVYSPSEQLVKYKHLNIMHGHEVPTGYANPARSLFLKTHGSCIVGHWHKSSDYTEQTINGDIISTWSVGCLCDLKPAYRPINTWNSGYAIIEGHKKDFKVNNYRIYNNTIY